MLDVLRSVQGPILAEAAPEEAVVLVQRWASREELEAHLGSEIYRRILAAIEISGSPPEVCFDTVSATEGMELIERSRSGIRPEGEATPGSSGSAL